MPSPQLADYVQQVGAIKADAQTFVPDLSPAAFNWTPGPSRWSIGQCLDHLNVGIRKTLPAFDAAIEQAWENGWVGEGPFEYGRWATWMIASMEPPPRMRMRTSKILVPSTSSDLRQEEVFPEFLRLRDALIERLESARGLDLRRARVISPINRLFRVNLGGYFGFIIAHDRRHLWQARQVLAALPPS
jgi:DinB family protein